MSRAIVASSAAVVAVLCLFTITAVAARDDAPEDAARAAVSEDPAEAKRAIAQLRERGPAGLAALFAAHADAIKAGPRPGEVSWQRLSAALDAVARQKDAYVSGLYWYTDLERAKSAAAREGKLILSLRLLGDLGSDLSCANSRFFRTTLYPDRAVSQLLRERFVLHWQSVRPVPVVTIDMGDGRTLTRTVTGNSAHYALYADGRVVDALPGLYSAAAFVAGLNDALATAVKVRGEVGTAREVLLRERHLALVARLSAALDADLRAAVARQPNLVRDAGQPAVWLERRAAAARAKDERRPAISAGPRATGKAFVEGPLTRALASVGEVDDLSPLWPAMAEARLASSAVSPEVRRAMAAKVGPSVSGDAFERMARNFERAVAVDTLRNEYFLRRQIHAWLAAGEGRDLDALNERVYAELFLTPSTDPWLGLIPPDTFSGIEGEGVMQ